MEVVRASPIAGGRMLIESGSLLRGALDGEVVVVTGAGHGIGVEAARSLLCLGAAVGWKDRSFLPSSPLSPAGMGKSSASWTAGRPKVSSTMEISL